MVEETCGIDTGVSSFNFPCKITLSSLVNYACPKRSGFQFELLNVGLSQKKSQKRKRRYFSTFYKIAMGINQNVPETQGQKKDLVKKSIFLPFYSS